MRANFRQSLKNSDQLRTMHGQSSTKYNAPSDPAMRRLLQWGRDKHPELVKGYIHADSAMFHNTGKAKRKEVVSMLEMVANLTKLEELYHASPEYAAFVAATTEENAKLDAKRSKHAAKSFHAFA